MPKIYEVTNVEEAVILASKMQDEGKYDWFRGQTKDWPAHSSLHRVKSNKDLLSKAEESYYTFLDWARKKTELKHLLEPANRHQLEAILQHYGFPTDYIDFSTEPSIAGFFACDTNSPPLDGHSCIYCLNTSDLLSIWEDIKDFDSRKGTKIEKVIVDVSNLWRLQAQRGVFLFANYNWEIDYPLDKIIFPYTGYPSYPTKDIIYPEHKSLLEILLDEFFDTQRGINFFSEWSPLFDAVYNLTSFPDGYNKEAFKDFGELKLLETWQENTKDWRNYKVEDYHTTTGISRKLSLKNKTSEIEIKNTVSYGISQMLRSDKMLRTKAINWILEDVASDIDSQKVCSLLTKIWSGMRLLPFSDNEVSVACGNLIYLHLKKVNTLDRDKQTQVFTELFGEGLFVGFSIEEGNGATGFASESGLLNSLDINFSNLLGNMRTIPQKPKELFGIIYNPKLMFDFNRFKAVFAQEIIPSQISMYEPYVIFNPAELVLFGNP